MRGCLISQARCINNTENKTWNAFPSLQQTELNNQSSGSRIQREQVTVKNWWKSRLYQASDKNLGLFLCSQATTTRLNGFCTKLSWFEINYKFLSVWQKIMKPWQDNRAGVMHRVHNGLAARRELVRTMHDLYQLCQRCPIPQNGDLPNQCHLFFIYKCFFHRDMQSELSVKGFFSLHCQHRLKISTLLNTVVIAEAGAKSFLKRSLHWGFLPLGRGLNCLT